MSEIEEKKCWSEVLPFLFNLLVDSADGIIDDTSLERILGWLKNVCKNEQQLQKLLQCGTVEFMASEQVFSNPESTAFFLRLFGFLNSKVEVFNSLKRGQEGDFLAKFLDKPKNDSNLWNEGIVRDGYFQALISLTEHKDGMLWLRSTGHIDDALDCISDRSMFVANSARSLIAKYLIRESDWILPSNPEKTMNSTVDVKKFTNVTETLRSVFTSESSTSMLFIAVIEVTRVLLCENSNSGQKVLQETKLFPQCLNLTKLGDVTVCQKLVDVVCEMAKNTSTWAVDWDRLISTEESSCSNILLESCVDLFKKGLISSGLELVAGLGFCQGSSRHFPPHWLEVLFGIVELPLEMFLNSPCHNTDGPSENGCHTDGVENLNNGLVDCLMSNDEQRKSFAKEQLRCILFPWIKEGCSLTHVICQALAAAQQLTQQASSTHHSHVFIWLKHSLALVQHCIDPTKQATVELHGNQKVLKASLEFISSFTKVQKSKDILEDTDSCAVNQLFDDVVGTLLQLIESSESNATVISSSLKTFGKVLDVARSEFITELFSGEKASEEVPEKRARLDPRPSCEDVQQSREVVKPANREKLAFVLYRRLRDSRWEVRDSTLEFIASLLRVNHDSVADFLCRHSIHEIVWNATDDTDSYVRASAIHVTGFIACQSQLWTSLLQTGHVTEEGILEKFSSVLEKDDEAFPRRRAMECLTLWIKTRHPVAELIFRLETAMDLQGSQTTERNVKLSSVEDAANQSLPEGIPKFEDFQNLRVGSRSEGTKTPSGFGIIRSVCHACQDFDWEVKLRGLEFWEAVIDFFTGFKSNKESTSLRDKCKPLFSEATVCGANDGESMKAGSVDELFKVLFNMGALKILSEALNDCDHMVCEKALEILASLQDIANLQKSNIEMSVKTSLDFQEFLGKKFGLETFKEVLRVTDFPALTQSTEAADSAVRSDPVSLIEDILMAATRQDENLLDCY